MTTRGNAGTGAAADRCWRLDHDGHRLQVETERVGWMRVVRLYVDGVQHAQTEALHQARIPYGDRSVLVAFDPLGLLDGQAARCVVTPPRPADDTEHEAEDETEHGIEPGTGNDAEDDSDDDTGEGDSSLPFTPPEGSRAARRERFARRHPALYASRHVAAATAKVGLGILGVSALVSAAVRPLVSHLPRPHVDLPDVDLPDVDLPDVDLPDVDLPDIDPPDLPLPDIPWPDVELPDVTLPAWLQAIVATGKYWMPILIAIGVAVHEVDRRKKNDRRHDTEHDDAHPRGKQS